LTEQEREDWANKCVALFIEGCRVKRAAD